MSLLFLLVFSLSFLNSAPLNVIIDTNCGSRLAGEPIGSPSFSVFHSSPTRMNLSLVDRMEFIPSEAGVDSIIYFRNGDEIHAAVEMAGMKLSTVEFGILDVPTVDQLLLFRVITSDHDIEKLFDIYLKFDDPSSISFDSSLYQRPFESSNVQASAGHSNGGCTFHSGSLMTLVNPIQIESGVYSIGAWLFAPFAFRNSYYTLTRGIGENGDHQLLFHPTSNGIYLGCYENGPQNFHSSGFNWESLSNGWHHVAVVADGITSKFYVDGRLVGSSNYVSRKNIYSIGNYQNGLQPIGLTDSFIFSLRNFSSSQIRLLMSL